MTTPDQIVAMAGVGTGRLRFRQLSMADVPGWMEFYASAAALKYLGYQLNDEAKCRAVIGRQITRYATDGSGLHALIEQQSGALVGQCGLLTQVIDGRTELEIGYHLLPAYWGRGFATEAAVACRDLAFERMPVASIISIIDPDNVGSQAVARRNGLRPELRTRWHGVEVDIWRLQRAQWQELRHSGALPPGGAQSREQP